MKKRNKILSAILASAVMCSSIPFFMTNANAAYFTDGSEWERTNSDYGKIHAKVTNTDYKFMQTEDNQEFTFNQHLSLEKAAGEAFARFNSLTLYTDGTNTDASLKVEEYPEKITTNGTGELLNKMNFSYSWSADNDNAADVGVSNGDIRAHDLRGTVVDLSGCPDYQWDCALSFVAVHPEDEPFGEIDTNYYWAFNWTYADVGLMGSRTTRQVRFKTDIVITDVRELKNEVDELKAQVEAYENGNPEGLTETRYLKLRKYIEAVPSGMLDGSSFYSQEEVNEMYAYVTETLTGLADYSEYNKLRKRIDEITKKDGENYVYEDGYTIESLNKVVEIYNTVKGLSISLPASKQSEVDEATAVLEEALDLLIAKSFYEQKMQSISEGGDVWDLSNDKLSSNWTDAKLDVHIIGTKYMYMQTYDEQNFNLYQWVFMRSRVDPFRDYGTVHPVLKYFVFDDNDSCGEGTCFDAGVDSANNSQAFVNRLSATQKGETANGTEYAQWDRGTHNYRYYEGSTEEIKNATDLHNRADKTIDEITIGGSVVARNTYLADANMIFTGLSGDTKSSQQDISFVWKFGVDNKEDSSNLYHFHVPVEVTVSDARDLVKLYDELTALAEDEEERLKYTESSINTILPALSEDNIPKDLIYGGKYYTQTEIDSYYNQLLGVKNNLEVVADYTEFNKAYEEALTRNNDDAKYEPGAFASYMATLENINAGLDKRLGETQQEVVDEATNRVNDLMTILEQNAYCDYSKLDYLIDYAESKFPEYTSQENYSEEIYAAMMESLNNAKAVDREMVKGVDGANQQIIDAATEELLYAIYYDYFDSASKDIIKNNNEDENGNKVYLDEEFEKFKEEYAKITSELEKDVVDETTSNHDDFEKVTTDLSNSHTKLEESKFVDLTDIKTAIEDAKELTNDGFTDSSWDDLQNAIDKAEDIVATNPVHGKDGVGTESVEDATREILDAIDNLKIKADYTEYENLKNEIDAIIAAGKDDLHSEEDWNKFVDSVTQIDNNLNKDLADTEENSEIIKSATEELEHAKAVYESNEKADYSGLDSALEQAETILNDTTGKYTESSKAALQEAYTKANAVDRELSSADQNVVDVLKEELDRALLGVKKKADYSKFNEAVKTAEELMNNEDIVYTSSSKQALEIALLVKENIIDDLSEDEQYQLDEAVENITEAINNLVIAADTTELKKELEEAKEIIANGNEDARYDDEDWQSFVDSITEAEQTVGGNLDDIPESEQENVNSAKDRISIATETLNSKRYIFVKFVSDSGELFESYRIPYQEGRVFGTLEAIPEIPENTDFVKYIGWYYKDGTLMELSDSITDDVTVFCIKEEIKIVAKAESEAVIDADKGFIKGLRDGVTVGTLIASLQNESDYIVVKDKDGNTIDNNSKIATGMTIELVSKTEQGKKNDIVTVVVKADVNGDGLVNDEDVKRSLDACCKRIEYTVDEKAYFEANDTNGDGVLDVLDAFNVSNMRYGNR